jgi:RNA polymerase sigma factor (sigma-70 family)
VPLTAQQQDLAAEFVGLARGQAWSYFNRSTGMELDDCLSAAMFGLVSGIDAYPGYCARNNFDAEAGHRTGWLKAHLLRRIRGAILDAARSADHMTRSDRHKVKAVRQAEDDGARTDAERAAATGLSVATVRRVEAQAQMAISLDDAREVIGEEPACLAGGDPEADPESAAVVGDIISAFLETFDQLDPETRVILALRYHGAELEFAGIAELMFTSPERIAQLHDEGVKAIHRALIVQASAEGTGARRPAQQVEISAHVRSADSCSAGEGAAVTDVTGMKHCNGPCGRWLSLEEFSFRDRAREYRVPYCRNCDRRRQRQYWVRPAQRAA